MAKDIVRIEPNRRLSRVTVHNAIAYLSGLTADDQELGIAGQTRQVLEKADRYLGLAGSGRSRLLSAQIWLRDIGDFEAMNQVWTAWIDPAQPPSRATVQSALALPGLLVEIMFIAAV